MLKKKTNCLKVFVLMITILFSITACTYATSIANVTGLTANISGDEVYLYWNSVSNASGYDVYFNVPGRGYINLGSVSTNSAKVSGFTPGYDYKTKIMAYKYVNGSKISSSAYSNEVSVMIPTVQNDLPSNASNLKVTMNDKQAYLTWDKANNATGYDVYFNVPGQGYMNLGSVDTNSAYVSGFTPGYTYYAKILAYKNSNGKKIYANNYSNEVSVKLAEEIDYSKPAKVSSLTARVDKTNVALDWNKVTNATGYDIYLYTPESGYKKLTSTSYNYYDIPVNTLQENKTYYVKVIAYRVVNGQTIYSNDFSDEKSFYIQEIVTKPNKATELRAYAGNAYVAVDWNKATNATGYDVYLYTSSYGYKKLASTPYNYYDIPVNTLQSGKTYYVKVLAYRYENGKTIYSNEYSNEASFYIGYNNVTKPDAITGLNVTVKGTVANFTWNKVNNVDGYELVMEIPGIGPVRLYSNTNSRTVSGLTTYGSSYTTSVYAYKYVNGEKVYGDPATVKVYRNNL